MTEKNNKNELIIYEEEKYEDFDISDEQIKNIKKINLNFKNNIIYISFIIIIVFILLFSLLIPKIIQKINKNKIMISYEESANSADENLGEINIEEEVFNDTYEEPFEIGNFNGNLIQNVKDNEVSNGKMVQINNYIYCLSNNNLLKIDSKTTKIISSNKILDGFELSNISKLNDKELVMVATGIDKSGIENSYIIFYNLDSGSYSYLSNIYETKYSHIINSMIVTSRGIYYTCIGQDDLLYLDLKTKTVTKKYKLSTQLMNYPRILDANEDFVYIMDLNGISRLDFKTETKDILSDFTNKSENKPIIYNDEVYYISENKLYKNDNEIYVAKSKIYAYNITIDKLFIATNKELICFDLNNNTTEKIYDSNVVIDSIYVFEDLIAINTNNTMFFNIK